MSIESQLLKDTSNRSFSTKKY